MVHSTELKENGLGKVYITVGRSP